MSSPAKCSALTLLAAALLAGCATSAQRQQMQEEELAVYSRHAGAPVDRIQSFRLLSWQPVSDDSLLLEARLNDWYLVGVGGPCNGLRFAHTIGIEQRMNTLQTRFDSIIVEGLPCRIETIRPIDARAVRAELRDLRQGR